MYIISILFVRGGVERDVHCNKSEVKQTGVGFAPPNTVPRLSSTSPAGKLFRYYFVG